MNDELLQLCEAAVEDRLSDEQTRRLEQLVLADAEARRCYVDYLHQHGALRWSAADPAYMERGTRKAERGPAPAATLAFSHRRRIFIAAGLAAAVLLAVGLWLTAPF